MKKNNEVATVTTQELSLVENMLLNTKQVGLLTKRTPAKYLMTRPAKGGGQWTYVTGAYMKKVLNLMFGFNWNFEVVEYKFDLDIKQAFVLGKLTCKTGNAEIIKMQFGRADIKFRTEWKDGKKIATREPLDLGNDLKAATTDALKKCAAEIGIAGDVYGKEEFKELRVVDAADVVDHYKIQREKILRLINDDFVSSQLGNIAKENIRRIIDEDEKESYITALKLLTNLNNETK